MIIVTGTIRVSEQTRAAAIKHGCEHSARARAEPGCLAHNCYVDAEDNLCIRFFEKWADEAAVKAHFSVPESRNFVREMTQLAVVPPAIELFNAKPSEGAPF